MGFLRYRSPSGETRAWTLKEIIQGRPINRPTHPMFVFFPIAFFVGTLAFDILSRFGLSGATLTATWTATGGVAMAVLAIVTGSVDRSMMRPGSRIRSVATRHMWLQLSATAIFAIDVAVRWSGRHLDKAKPLWIALDALGTLAVIVGGDVGGQMVFKMGYRVGESGSAGPAEADPAVAQPFPMTGGDPTS
jgi:uncharacterized membrane protein